MGPQPLQDDLKKFDLRLPQAAKKSTKNQTKQNNPHFTTKNIQKLLKISMCGCCNSSIMNKTKNTQKVYSI